MTDELTPTGEHPDKRITPELISGALRVLAEYHRSCGEPITRFRDEDIDADVYVISHPELKDAFRMATGVLFGRPEEIGARLKRQEVPHA